LLAATSVVTIAAAMVVGAGPASASPPSSDPSPAQAVAPAAASLSPSTKLAGGLASLKSGRKQVFVQLAGEGAADASAAAASQGATGMKAAANAAKASAKNRAATVWGTARGKDARARQLFQVGNAIPGFAVDADVAAIQAMAASADVVKITPLVPKTYQNTNGAELTNVLKTWQNTGTLGAGVRVGIIDTGLDYTHADFGGPGTTAAWNDAHANNTDPNWYSTLSAKAKLKVGGGYDFVGDNYNADPKADDYQPVPHPDSDPIDCAEHGTHVAGILAGYGENADGTTFTGTYASLDTASLNAMKIGPGMAPAATIYSLKVFGCTGSTDEVIPALDWALDPNGDGNFSDHLDIVNLSLGSDYGVADDPENAVVDQLAKHGVLPVIAMGNAGDLTDIGGSPGNALRSLAVASSVDADEPLDGLRVNAPASDAGVVAAQFSIAYPWSTAAPVTGSVVAPSSVNSDGCDPLSGADAAAVAGKVAWLTWDSNDATRRCGSAARSANVAAAGAIGAIFTGDVDPFTAGITGSATIPVVQLTVAATQQLQPALQAGTLNVTFDGSLAVSQDTVNPAITDTISSFSSRGTHGSIGVVKPDVAAPGDSILSAGMGLGQDGLVLSGTSMATPHTAGIAALVKAAHKNWSAEQVKAAIMNTAGHEVYSQPGQTGPIYGPARDGAGRVDALAAVSTSIIAYDTDRSIRGGVSASFGVVEAPVTSSTITQTRTVTIQNTGSSTANLRLSYAAAITEPGVSYRVVPSTVRVGAGRSANVTVILTVKPRQLAHTIDPTMEVDQIGVPRNYLSDASGRLLISQTGKADLRVPVYAAVKPVSRTSASDGTIGRGKNATPAITLSGTGFDQGSGSTAWTSLVSVMDLGAISPRLPMCRGRITTHCTANESATAGDIQYVGSGTANGWLYFGISTYGNWAALDNPALIPYIQIDTNGDGKPDYEVDVLPYDGTDVLLAELFDLHTGRNLDLEPVNFQFGDVDTNVFDSNVLVVPVDPSLLGIPAGATTFPITYSVGMSSYLAVNSNGDIDDVGPIRYDVLNPKVQVGSFLYADLGHTAIPYVLGTTPSATTAATVLGKGASTAGHGDDHGKKPKQTTNALVLHLHGASGQRAQVVKLGG
jgi:subtilisin family serine protease